MNTEHDIEYDIATAQEQDKVRNTNRASYNRKKETKNTGEKRIYVAPKNNRSTVKQQFSRVRCSADWKVDE